MAKNQKLETKNKKQDKGEKEAVETASDTVIKSKKTSKKTSAKAAKTTEKTAPKSTPAKKTPTVKTSKKEPTTMEELLAQTGGDINILKKGDIVKGVIAHISPRQIRVDVGGKTEAVVHEREVSLVSDLADEFQIGTKVQVYVVNPENDQGQPVVSLRQTAFEKRWELLSQKQKKEEIIPVTITEAGRGGFLIQGFGIRGFLPFSQADSELVQLKEKAHGRKIKVKVLEVDKSANRFVVSQRFEGQKGDLGRQAEVLKKAKEGEDYQAEISGVVVFGAFAKVTIVKDEPPLEGLIHISEIAWEKVEDPKEYIKENDKLTVKVIGVDKKSGRLTLSLKQLKPDPWQDVGKAFEKDQQVSGKVTRTSNYGVFVRLVPGIEGLVHISKIPPGEDPKIGDKVTCVVEEVSVESRRISLSLVSKAKPIGYR